MTLSPARGVVIVTPIETQETVAGGLVVLTENARKDWAQWQMEVVAVGEPSVCEKPEDCDRPHVLCQCSCDAVPPGHTPACDRPALHCRDDRLVIGAWVLVEPRSIVPLSLDTALYAVRQEQVVGVFQEAP